MFDKMLAFNEFDQEKDYKYPMAPDIIELEEHENLWVCYAHDLRQAKGLLS